MLHIHDFQSSNPTTPAPCHFVEHLAVTKKIRATLTFTKSPTFPVSTTIAAQKLQAQVFRGLSLRRRRLHERRRHRAGAEAMKVVYVSPPVEMPMGSCGIGLYVTDKWGHLPVEQVGP